VAAACALLLAGAACSLNPVTGAPELLAMSAERERTIGREVAKTLEAQIGLIDDEALTRYVQEIGGRVAEGSPRRDLTYTFYALDDPVPNAFALPGGYIYVTRGMLGLATREDQIAAVIGHAIAHAAARDLNGPGWGDTALRALATLLAIGGGPSLGSLVNDDVANRKLTAEELEQELRADRVGQDLTRAAGFDPVAYGELLRALQREQQLHATQRPRRTIPFPDLRAEISRERIDAADAHASSLGRPEATARVREDYLAEVAGIALDQDARAGVFVEDSVFLQADLDLYVQFPEEWRQVNADAFVGANDGGAVFVKLELQPGMLDGREAARAYFKSEREKADARDASDAKPDTFERTRSGPRLIGKDTRAYVVEGKLDGGRGTVYIYWIAAGEHMYRLTCTMATVLRGSYAQDCLRTASSIRTMRPGERDKIYQVTLALDSVRPNESLNAFSERVENAWSIDETAAANGLSLPYALEPGQRLKYAKREIYVAAPQPPASAPAAEPAAKPADPPATAPQDTPSAGAGD
jgi:predicted Zn-dependent protease